MWYRRGCQALQHEMYHMSHGHVTWPSVAHGPKVNCLNESGRVVMFVFVWVRANV